MRNIFAAALAALSLSACSIESEKSFDQTSSEAQCAQCKEAAE